MATKTARRSAPGPKAGDRPTARERLLAAADELFYAEGVHVVGIDRIVQRAGVAKASLYDAFGSKDDLVKAYLERHFRRRQDRIAGIRASSNTARDQILGVFAEVEELLAGPTFRGCPFISAATESRPDEAGEVVTDKYRTWLRSVFTDLSRTAGAKDPQDLGSQLLLLYDGAFLAGRMDKDRAAAARGIHSAAVTLLEAAVPTEPRRRRKRTETERSVL